MMKWPFFIVLAISGGILWYLYTNLDNSALTSNGTATSGIQSVIAVTHSYQDGVHRFSGEIKLSHSCYSIDTQTVSDPKSEDRLVIKITTTDHFLERSTCAKFSTRYEFQVIAEAPKDVAYTLQVDGKELPIRTSNVDWNNPNAFFVNPR
ncbi:MAG: hypothetical protein A2845_02250 [Candidatus Lloydbacteria bacterium RIFCSPHIGHO2_01_FULL_49_22]|uniref:Uncharacterized protein n=1 Tax=Candidatus Lloydbacteria bacterium RIFCSPHIGHO2_01_FULL_49_22 TaxID=1798658 RepID=A0A1G2CWV1_9BACT|nr:MAG: hypothetical protein A2845_02250 [Candidatus Lloydbacteria bacterium RIFCSPHIGHO2_01_FULL_49_22]OGZ10273.1 MAG: hypothetical protein A3C14_01950 [Candidatus Lloydbacteria bacterium RIFCSPHIGHO2_02_FULL_50_18]